MATMQKIRNAADGLRKLLPKDFRPEMGIIGGSGLAALEEAVMEPRWEVPYGKIEGFPVSTGKLPLSSFVRIYMFLRGCFLIVGGFW